MYREVKHIVFQVLGIRIYKNLLKRAVSTVANPVEMPTFRASAVIKEDPGLLLLLIPVIPSLTSLTSNGSKAAEEDGSFSLLSVSLCSKEV